MTQPRRAIVARVGLTDLFFRGIARSGSSGSYSYSVIGSSGNFPITYVSWGDAARFANWLQNGQPTGAQGPGTTETGSYTLNGATSNTALNAITRNSSAKFVLPNENEWYKAAYHSPSGRYSSSTARELFSGATSPPLGSIPVLTASWLLWKRCRQNRGSWHESSTDSPSQRT